MGVIWQVLPWYNLIAIFFIVALILKDLHKVHGIIRHFTNVFWSIVWGAFWPAWIIAVVTR